MATAVERLTTEDRLILWPDERWPQDVGALGILDGRPLLDARGAFDLDTARRAVAGRLHLLPRFRQVLYVPQRRLGGPLWVDDESFDIRDHVRVAPLPAPGEEAQLLRTVERLRRHRLDRSRPLWEIWFLPGLAEGRVGMYVRLHHVVADGIAGVASLSTLFDLAPETATTVAPPWTPRPRPRPGELRADSRRQRATRWRSRCARVVHPRAAVREVRGAWPAVRELVAGTPGPHTSLDRVIGAERRLALVRTDLELVQRVGHTHGGTVNDVLLALIAGGLARLLRHRGEPVDELALPVFVPVSLRHVRTGRQGGNLISQMVVRLPLGVADPGQRLRQIAAETAGAKAIRRPSLGTMFGSKVLRIVMLRFIVRQRVNVVTADLPGPPLPLYFAGAPLLEVFPLLNLLGNESLGVGALSYAGKLGVMAVADAAGYPDLDVCVAGLGHELTALAAPGRVATRQRAGRRLVVTESRTSRSKWPRWAPLPAGGCGLA